MQESQIETARSFMRGVKEGEIRGDAVTIQVSDSIILELSVSTFEFGCIHLRVMVTDDRLDSADDYNHFQQLFAVDHSYQSFYDEVYELVESENETDVSNAHSWEATNPNSNHPEAPEEFTSGSAVWFSSYVDLRDPLSMEEAIRTNRS